VRRAGQTLATLDSHFFELEDVDMREHL
jgi:hypothetical protein